MNPDKNNIFILSEEKRCAPGKDFKEGSCFDLEQLKKIAQQFNKNLNENINFQNKTKKDLLKILINKIKDKYDCDDQLCWLNLDIVKDLDDIEIEKYTFRPPGPSIGTKWLNTSNIDDVLVQYEKIYKDFFSCGAVPLDFSNLQQLKMNLPENSLQNLVNKGIKKIGIVYNHDYSNMTGSHWVAMFINLDKGLICYFDSYGIKPKKEINDYKDFIINFIKNKMNKNVTYKWNTIRHQFKGSECGVYSINFILRLLKGESFEDITKNITKDDDVNLCRSIYFI
tara:strand:+ start:129 stop:974 length:846 start_codon:yes stop_codon:yes gene_type:complete